MQDFSSRENLCSRIFSDIGECRHLWTSENNEIIFKDEDSFRIGMGIFGISAALVPEAKILTFVLMSNHFHVVLAGNECAVDEFFHRVRTYLVKNLKYGNIGRGAKDLRCSSRMMTSINDMRNVIAYNNRNGYVVNDEVTPFSYQWGANQYYFNPSAKRLSMLNSVKTTCRERRTLIRCHDADNVDSLYLFDGYICPMSFCHIEAGERMYRSASHYFFEVSRNVESKKDIAMALRERVFYTDDELFAAISDICRTKYYVSTPSLLSAKAKIEMAKTMRYEYNSSRKQIMRMLKLNQSVVESLFPEIDSGNKK